MISPVVVGIVRKAALDRQTGLVNELVSALGFGRPGRLVSPDLAIATIVLVGVWIHGRRLRRRVPRGAALRQPAPARPALGPPAGGGRPAGAQRPRGAPGPPGTGDTCRRRELEPPLTPVLRGAFAKLSRRVVKRW
ncbi:hypothetical protein ACFZDK_35495 [Streptomyces sp. NPDC007901]|uniref:hypothetical protein n=1 Tax=Streptomyces sp. NPDC007901 TaxID=3364785 RepID=UPI0036F07792